MQWWTVRFHPRDMKQSKVVKKLLKQDIQLNRFWLCARLRIFAFVSRKFAPVSRDHRSTFSSFTPGSCKLATCSHPVQGHDGSAILTDEPSNCKLPPMKGLHMFGSAHLGRPFMIAWHESGTLVWGWSRMYVYTLILSRQRQPMHLSKACW
jgi:hypothetical protein